MMANENVYQRRYQSRIKERHLWLRIGLALFISGFGLIAITTIGLFFNIISPVSLVNAGAFGVVSGSVISMFLGRLGWSKSKLADMFFNRLSILLIIVGLVSVWFDKLLPSAVSYGAIYIGIILVLLGIRNQTPM